MSQATSNTLDLAMECSIDSSFEELKQDYHNAVECIVHCESLIKTLEEQLVSKDEHIASLEDKLVQMSLELAYCKASEDARRPSRTSDCNIGSERISIQTDDVVQDLAPKDLERPNHRVSLVDETEDCNTKPDKNQHMFGRAKSVDTDAEDAEIPTKVDNPSNDRPCRRRSFFGFSQELDDKLGEGSNRGSTSLQSSATSDLSESLSNKLGQFFGMNQSGRALQEGFAAKDHEYLADESDRSTRQGWNLDESSPIRLSNFGQLFTRKGPLNRSGRRADVQEQEEVPTKVDEPSNADDDGSRPPRRRRPNARLLHMQPSARTLISSAVCWPISAEDCMEGLIDRSIVKRLQGPLTDEDWQACLQ